MLPTWKNHSDKYSKQLFHMEFLRDLWGYLKVRKKYWLLPLILILLLLGFLIIFTGGSAVGPFIYTLF
jgi:hypothetical protein